MEPLSVLLVDDEEDLVLAMAERLALRGFHVDTATNAADALRRLAEKDFSVLILDVKMPGRGGLRLMSEIKKEHPNLPVILFTGHGSTADAARGVQEGAFDCLMKPVQVDELIEKIRTAAGVTKGSCS
jgi:DNA-binding NtrC family response regulator